MTLTFYNHREDFFGFIHINLARPENLLPGPGFSKCGPGLLPLRGAMERVGTEHDIAKNKNETVDGG